MPSRGLPITITKGELAELRLLAKGPQPAYVEHGNRARARTQNRLVLDFGMAVYRPSNAHPTTCEITGAGIHAIPAPAWTATTVRQPWAEALIRLGKGIENRERHDGTVPTICRLRGVVLIHAAAGCSRSEHYVATNAMRGNGVLPDGMFPPGYKELVRGGIIGVMRAIGLVLPDGRVLIDQATTPEQRNVDMRWHEPGQHGLVLVDPMRLPFVPCKGQLGPFKVNDELLGPNVARLVHEYAARCP